VQVLAVGDVNGEMSLIISANSSNNSVNLLDSVGYFLRLDMEFHL
jgi:hypothetical protein